MTLSMPSSSRLVGATLAAAIALVAFAAAPAIADAKAPSCLRDGAKLLAASGNTRIISIKQRPQGSETKRERVMSCRTPTGRRSTLFLRRDFGLDLIEHNQFWIVDDRYVGAIRTFEGGVSESRTATNWDTYKRVKLHDSSACDKVDQGDFSGVDDAVFLPRGGMAYACRTLRIADSAGDRELEPAGTDVRSLAVSDNNRAFSGVLFWIVAVGEVETAKSLALTH